MTETTGSTDLLASLGVTYRQVDYWCTKGLVPGQGLSPGYGCPRAFTEEQVEHIRVMSALVHDGLHPRIASQVAELLCAGEPAEIGGYLLTPKAAS